MAIRIMDDGHSTKAVMYDSTTGWAFGPVADECGGCGMDAIAVLEHFIECAKEKHYLDIRQYSPFELTRLWVEFHQAEHTHEEGN